MFIDSLDAFSTYKEYKPLLFNKYRGCQACGNDRYSELVIHHVTYERYGSEKPNDLRLLCWWCHDSFHKQVKGKDPFLREKTNQFIKNGRVFE